MYAPKNKASKHTKQKLTKLKGETDKSTIIVGKTESEREKNRGSERQRQGGKRGKQIQRQRAQVRERDVT